MGLLPISELDKHEKRRGRKKMEGFAADVKTEEEIFQRQQTRLVISKKHHAHTHACNIRIRGTH